MAPTMSIAASRRVAAQPTVRATRSRSSTVQVSAFKVTLQMPGGKVKQLEVAPDESVMDAVDAAGMELPYLCRSGTCGTCAGRIIEGKVELKGQHILDPAQVAAGFALMCSSYPRSDLIIQTHQEEACNTVPYGFTYKK